MFKQIFLALAPATSTYAIDYSSCDKGLCFGVPAGCVETEALLLLFFNLMVKS